MRIVQLVAGSGPLFYCENCARDDSFAASLRGRGHEVLTACLYLPLTPDGPRSSSPPPVFLGAVSLSLLHRFPSFRRAPRWVKALLDSPAVLGLAGRLAGSTNAAGLEELTLSMLDGEDPAQEAEIGRLMQWIAAMRPDIVHLSNCLLLGVARRIRHELGLPVACTLQDEDTWIDAMGESARRRAWDLLRDKAADVQMFLPVSAAYADFMAPRLAITGDRLAVVPVGVDMEDPGGPQELPFDPPVIGFLSRTSERMGLGILADAFVILASGGEFPGVGLRLMGGGTWNDGPLLASIRRRLARAGLRERLEVAPTFGKRERIQFLRGLTVLSVPVKGGEAFGTFLIEAMACGVPVVQPRAGGFTEIVEDTGGGILYEPNAPHALAAALGALLRDREQARRLGQAGRKAVRARYTAACTAPRVEAAFIGAIESSRRVQG